MRIVFLKPPFFRLVGSHNNKIPVELSYWRGEATQLGAETFLYNADYTPATRFWSWRTLFQRTDLFKQAVDGAADPMLYETLECVLSLKPDVVVISSDDVFIPTVCLDNAFVNARLARMFRVQGVRTVGVGKFFSSDIQFAESFDLILRGGPNTVGARMIMSGVEGVQDCGAWEPTTMPNISEVLPVPAAMDSSYVVTRRGCSFPCSFCYNTLVSPRFIRRPVENVRDDILSRMQSGRSKFYLTDQIFTIHNDHLRNLHKCFSESPVRECTFTVEGRSELIARDPAMVEMLRKLNVTVVKMGVENVGAKFNATSEKDQKTDGIRHAAKLLKDAGIHVVAYLLLGGETSVEEYEETLAFCKEVGFDSYVINVWSYPMDELTTAKYRYDAHFSTEKLKRWEIPMEIVEKYLDLHASKGGNPNLSFFGL